jgi:NADPH2:quinone reductase
MNVLTVSGTGSLVRAERPLPEPEASEVLVEVAYAGVNFADLGTKEGVPGSEVAGRIVACGDGVQALRVGDAVVGMRAVEGYAELARVPAAFATKLPPTVSLETAAAAYLQGLTAYHLLHTAGRLSPGERVLVLAGAGGVGGLAIQWARLAQAGAIVAVASAPEKRRHALSLGADRAVAYEEIAGLGEQAVDLALDSVGGQAFQDILRVLASHGRVVVYGQADGVRPPLAVGGLIGRCQTVAGFSISTLGLTAPAPFAAGVAELLAALAAGRLRPVIDRVYPWQEGDEAWARLRARQSAGKLLLAFGAG